MAYSFIATNTPIANTSPGQVIKMETAISAADAASSGASWNIFLFLYNAQNVKVNQVYCGGRVITTTPQTFTSMFTLPADFPAGAYRFVASVQDSGWHWQTVTQEPSSFSVGAPPIPLYGTYWKLPLLKATGDGFIPDTGEAFTLIAGASDEFNGTTLDLTKWKSRYIYNNGTLDYLNDECQRYVDNHVVSNGTLKLTAKVRPGTTAHPPSAGGITYSLYDSSMIRSLTTFKYGYFEARVRVPPGLGVWPAFWINPQVGWPPETDIFEYVRNSATEFPNMIHSAVHPSGAYQYADLNMNQQWGYWRAPPDLDPNYFPTCFHTMSAFWNQDGVVTFYIDGYPVAARRQLWKHTDGSDGGMAHLLLNLAMGGSWPTANWTTAIATDDQIFEIDYVRTYQKSDMINTGTSTI